MADETTNVEGQSFDNPALRGSGTILPDGKIGDNLPDPTEVRGVDGRSTSGGRTLPDLPDTDPYAKLLKDRGVTREDEAPADETSTPRKSTRSTAK